MIIITGIRNEDLLETMTEALDNLCRLDEDELESDIVVITDEGKIEFWNSFGALTTEHNLI